MLDILGIADALKTTASGVSGVTVAMLGVNQAFPTTPAVEIIAADARLQTLAAGQTAQLESLRLQVVIYVAASRNLEEDERALIPIAEGFVDALTSGSFDATLSGKVEDVRVTHIEFDLVKRENRWYRVAAIEVWAGDLDGSI